jgi:hypothetical protein
MFVVGKAGEIFKPRRCDIGFDVTPTGFLDTG